MPLHLSPFCPLCSQASVPDAKNAKSRFLRQCRSLSMAVVDTVTLAIEGDATMNLLPGLEQAPHKCLLTVLLHFAARVRQISHKLPRRAQAPTAFPSVLPRSSSRSSRSGAAAVVVVVSLMLPYNMVIPQKLPKRPKPSEVFETDSWL